MYRLGPAWTGGACAITHLSVLSSLCGSVAKVSVVAEALSGLLARCIDGGSTAKHLSPISGINRIGLTVLIQ